MEEFLFLLLLSSVNTCGRQPAGSCLRLRGERRQSRSVKPAGGHWDVLHRSNSQRPPAAADATAHRGPGDGGGGERCSRMSVGVSLCSCSLREACIGEMPASAWAEEWVVLS